MIITNNPLLQGARGKINNLVVRQMDGKTVVSAVPDMSRRKLSEKQLQANKLMRKAIASALHITGNPKVKAFACQQLDVPPNKVFREIVKRYIISKGTDNFMDGQQIDDELLDTRNIKAAIIASIPDAAISLFGARAISYGKPDTDWDLLVLTGEHYPKSVQWELQEKLFDLVTVRSGARINLILAQKELWYTSPEWMLLKERVGETKAL